MKKPARLIWPLLLTIIGIAFLVVAISSTIEMFRKSGTSFVGPGTTSINITTPGDYTLWHENKTLIDGKFVSFPDELPSGTTIQIFKQPEGTAVPMQKAGSSSMEVNGTRRVSVGDLTFNQPGKYQMVVTGLTEKHAFYLDEAKFLRMLFSVLVYTFAGILFLFAGIGLGIYFLVKAKR